MNKKIRSLSVCGAAMFFSLLVSSAFGYEKEIEQLSSQMAEKIAGKDKKTVAVVDFTDLEGNVTQLDQFIAEEFSVALASAGKGFRVLDRTRLKSIIKENKLAATGLIDPATASKLGKIAGVDALVTGTLTPFGDNVRLTVKVLDSEPADIIDSAKSNLAKTKAMDELLNKEIENTAQKRQNTSKLSEGAIPVVDTAEQDDFIFELHECKVSNKKVKCLLQITNKGQDRNILFGWRSGWGNGPKSRIFDENGNEYPFSGVEVANKSSKENVNHLFFTETPVKSSISFEAFSQNANSISLLEIEINISRSYSEHADNPAIIKFRNIHLSK